ncbi:MAG: molybdate ABC transporter substrate-binding protein [Xanthobacteraceae bacterium]
MVGSSLTVFCARSMTPVVQSIAERFTRGTDCEVAITFATVGALQKRLDAGESAEVVILNASAVASMERAGRLLVGMSCDIARTSIGVAVAEGAAAPDIATIDGFKQALLAARAVAFSDPRVGGSAGVYLATLWGRLGVADEIGRKGLPQQTGAEVARRVAEGAAELGLTLVAELVPISGVRVIGKIPAPFGNDTTYAAGISTAASDRGTSAAFIAALRSAAERERWTAAGFDPAS